MIPNPPNPPNQPNPPNPPDAGGTTSGTTSGVPTEPVVITPPVLPAVPPSAPQPVQPLPLSYVGLIAPYLMQGLCIVGAIVYFVVRDNVTPDVVILALSTLSGLNVVQGTITGVAHLNTNAAIQKTAIQAGESIATHPKGNGGAGGGSGGSGE